MAEFCTEGFRAALKSAPLRLNFKKVQRRGADSKGFDP
jgi:hypothetical protein